MSLAALLAACSSVGESRSSALRALTPYKVEVVQGNFVSREQVEALQPGMSRQQVREILGTPLVTSAFHHDRWEYVFTIKRQGVEAQSRKLSVFFDGERLARFEGDEMPTEAEFVATLGKPLHKLKIPNLEATEAQLAKYPARTQPATPAVVNEAAPRRDYPPLESTR